jgi:hypothetical protein
VSFRQARWVGGTGGVTMKKRVSGYPRWRWRAGAVLFVGSSLVILFLLKLQSLVLDDSLDDVLLTSHRDTGSTEYRNSTKPKLAFMFLARESMPLDILWQHFFEGSHEHEYSVYIHARPGYVYTKTATKCHAFINRQIKKPIQVGWGEATMIEAERLLLSAALQDPLNLRFLLLSDRYFIYICLHEILSQEAEQKEIIIS